MTEQEEFLKKCIEYERGLVHSGKEAKYGATAGPLKTLIPVFIDFETWMSADVRLGSMTLRQYLAATHLTAMSIAVGYDEPEVFLIPDGIFAEEDENLLTVLDDLAKDPAYIFVAHNAAFDIRVMRFLIGTPQPQNVWCTMEGAMGAWPELPGGYGLENICKRLNFRDDLKKLKIDLNNCTDEQLLEYNKRDVRSMQELYARQIALLPAEEQEVAIRTHRQRQFYFKVNQEKLTNLMTVLVTQAHYAEKEAEQYLVDQTDLGEIFNREKGPLRSIRSQRLLKIINTKMGGGFTSTSLKKISPLKLAQNQQVAALLAQTSNANKMLSHQRRSKIFIGVDEVDVELGYMRAHTGRFSSPSSGKGFNLHNCVQEGTKIPTSNGYKAIEDVLITDLVWDGFDWVNHSGLSCEGERECIQVGDIYVTPEQPVLTDKGWVDACRVKNSYPQLSGHYLDDGRFVVIQYANEQKEVRQEIKSDKPTNGIQRVYDLLDCGPRGQYQAGKIIVKNCPKHNVLIAKPIRSIFRLPDNLCFVRADLSNVEYRVSSKLTDCKTVKKMFEPSLGGNVFTDPYCEAWKAMTAQKITKKDPIRQVAKAAVLGLGFMMGPTGYARQSLLTAMADKKSGVDEKVLTGIADELCWKVPSNDGVTRVMKALGCSQIVALCSYHIHRVFNAAHPEFAITSDWLVSAVTAIAAAYTREDCETAIKRAYESTRAPDPKMIGLEIDDDNTFDRCSVRVRCGPWPRTVCWRNPKSRPTTFGADGIGDRKLTILKASGEFKPFTRQLAIENVTQAAARNGLCWAVAELERAGFPNVLHVHDEILIITERKRESVLNARQAMIDIVGPDSRHPLGWAVMVKPSEICVTGSMYESEVDLMPLGYVDSKSGEIGRDRWAQIEKNAPDCLENLT